MLNQNESRASLLIPIVLCYLMPILFLSGYSFHLLPPGKGLYAFSIGLLMAMSGSIILYLMTKSDIDLATSLEETEVTMSITPEPILAQPEAETSEWRLRHADLFKDFQQLQQQLQNVSEEKEHAESQFQSIARELNAVNYTLQQTVQQKDAVIRDFQRTILEQNGQIEKHQQNIAQLENKERDLQFEIKTLLAVSKNESHSISQSVEEELTSSYSLGVLPHSVDTIDSPQVASAKLKRCIDMAIEMSGAHHIGHSALFRDVPVDNSALDLRRLLDNLRMESSSIIILYSQKEDRLLFVNAFVKNLLGWSMDKFIQNFYEIIEGCEQEWEEAVEILHRNKEVCVTLSLKTKIGGILPLQCHLSAIPSGLFRHHAIGILYEIKDETQ